jgi:hypothetical protein
MGTGRWNVLVPDTVRADHLSVNGYPKPTCPALEALVQEGVNFTQAITTAPRTWQSFASLERVSGHGRSSVLRKGHASSRDAPHVNDPASRAGVAPGSRLASMGWDYGSWGLRPSGTQ